MSRRRILILAPFPPRHDGTHGGSRAIAGLTTQLAARHAVALACLRAADDPPVDPAVTAACDLVREIPRPPRSHLRRLPDLARGIPMWVAARAVPAFGAAVGELARQWQPDVVQAEFHAMAQYFDAAGSDPLRILVEHEPGVSVAREHVNRWAPDTPLAGRSLLDWAAARFRGVPGLVARADARVWARYERKALRAADSVVVFTERDRKALLPLAGATPIVCIPLGAPLPEQPLDPLGREPALVFAGNFRHPPNLDAARRLLDAIFPTVRSRRPDARLYLVGDGAPRELLARTGPGIVVTGRVPDVTPYLDRAAVVVVPLRLGGGMRVKVLEALAAGKALVASPLAVEGLALTSGEQCVTAETDAEFAAATLRLLEEPALRSTLAARARAWAEATIGWERTAAAYDALYATLRREAHR